MQHVFVRFLKESSAWKKSFRDYLTFSSYSEKILVIPNNISHLATAINNVRNQTIVLNHPRAMRYISFPLRQIHLDTLRVNLHSFGKQRNISQDFTWDAPSLCTLQNFCNLWQTFDIWVRKSNNLQYNTLGHWVHHLIGQVSDGPSIILIDWK